MSDVNKNEGQVNLLSEEEIGFSLSFQRLRLVQRVVEAVKTVGYNPTEVENFLQKSSSLNQYKKKPVNPFFQELKAKLFGKSTIFENQH